MLKRLSGRKDFLRVREVGRRWHGKWLTLSAAPASDPAAPTRVGVVATRKVGRAVQRNRARRLLREAVRQLSAQIPPGWDMVLIAHPPIADRAVHEPLVREELQWLLIQAQIIPPQTSRCQAASASG